MQGFQFGHIETWSRAGVAQQKGRRSNYRRNGQRAWTPEEVIAEAEREHEASPHVTPNGHKPVVWPGTCASFKELRKAHDEAASVTVAFPYTDPKTGKKKTRKRALRKDAHTLYTSVVSLPVTSAEALGEKGKMKEALRALRIAVAFEKTRLEEVGGEFAMAVIHLDEKQVHVHVFGLDRSRGSVNALHPGKAALDEFRAEHGALARTGTALFQHSKRAYCDAMRGWQDDLHREVSQKVGLTRFGPGRSRMSRSEWKRWTREEEERAKTSASLGETRRLRETVGRATTLLEEREALNSEHEAALAAEDQRLNAEASDLANRSAAVAERASMVQAQEVANAAGAESLRARTAAVEAKEKQAKHDAEAAVTRLGEAEEKQKKLAEREQDVEAGAAMIEAMTEGALVLEDEAGRPTFRITDEAKSLPSWPKARAAMKAAPEAARAMVNRLGQSMTALRHKAAKDGLADAREAAKKEVQDELTAVRRAATSIAAVGVFVRSLIARLPQGERAEAEEEFATRTRRAVADQIGAERKAARSRDSGSKVQE